MDTGTQHDFEDHDAESMTEEATLEAESNTTSEELDSSFHMSS